MKALRSLLGVHHGDVPGQKLGAVGNQPGAFRFAGQLDAGHLSPGMDSGVGAAGALHLHRCTVQLAQHALQLALNGVSRVALHLPAAVPAAVVLNGQLVVLHFVHLMCTLFSPQNAVGIATIIAECAQKRNYRSRMTRRGRIPWAAMAPR